VVFYRLAEKVPLRLVPTVPMTKPPLRPAIGGAAVRSSAGGRGLAAGPLNVTGGVFPVVKLDSRPAPIRALAGKPRPNSVQQTSIGFHCTVTGPEC